MMTNVIAEMSSSSVVGMVFWIVLIGMFVSLNTAINPLSEKWKLYEGSIITGIKLAEKQISDDTSSKGLAKLDFALKFVLDAYAEANKGKLPSKKLTNVIKEGIQIKHAELDKFGGVSAVQNG